MKKYFLGIFAVVLALGLSSFTQTKKSLTDYSWFDNSGNLVGTSQSLNDNLLGCPNIGTGCGRVYQGDFTTEPGTSSPSFIESYRTN
jgi:hypothetical protein